MSIREPGLLGKMSYRVLCLVFGSHQKREPAASGSRESKRGARRGAVNRFKNQVFYYTGLNLKLKFFSLRGVN